MDILQSYRIKLRHFANQVPQLLSRHPETIEQARLIQAQIAGLEDLECFRLAVTGKFKQGKSTLINGLIGRSLPTVGVNETTATLNFICYGKGDELNKIKIRWKDRVKADEEQPLEFLSRLQGKEGKSLAERIECIFLYADASFLGNVQLIDTPGEMGTRLNAIEVKADALIRVLPFVAEANDLDKLGKFGADTRPFGSCAYNTIGVMQKWEEHWPVNSTASDRYDPFETDPFENALKRAREQRNALGDAVSEVLPVSGLLDLFSVNATETSLNRILEFTTSASKDDLIDMLNGSDYFLEDDYANVSVAVRKNIWAELKSALGDHSSVTWPILKMAIWATHRYSPGNANELRAHFHAMSNMDALHAILKKRFFALSELIQIGSQLNKVLDPCDNALYQLRIKRENSQFLQQEGIEALSTLDTISSSNHLETKAVRDYIDKLKNIAAKDVLWLEETCQQVSMLNTGVKNDFDAIQKEVDFLNLLDNEGENEQLNEVRRIFGQFGIEIYQRLGCEENTSLEEMRKKAWALLKHWRSENFILSRDILDALLSRLNLILDILDTDNNIE